MSLPACNAWAYERAPLTLPKDPHASRLAWNLCKTACMFYDAHASDSTKNLSVKRFVEWETRARSPDSETEIP